MTHTVLIIGILPDNLAKALLAEAYRIEHCRDAQAAWAYLQAALQGHKQAPSLVLSSLPNDELVRVGRIRQTQRSVKTLAGIPFVLLLAEATPDALKLVKDMAPNDAFPHSVAPELLLARLAGLLARPAEALAPQANKLPPLPLWKRGFDVLGSAFIILMLSPLFLLVALLIRMESKGPVFYFSKRAGRGFKVFNFYKFRSMRVDADKMLAQVKNLSQYKEEAKQKAATASIQVESNEVLLMDDGHITEAERLQKKVEEQAGTFVKIENDPRITRVGRIIRSTSIDELPQLFNVLKGDMSLVGNRPLPLYEAEQLTSDEWVERFDGPAGITGLWQVTERGKAGVSEDSRKRLDIEYARNYSLWLDLKILIKTPLAAIQKVNV